MPPSARAAFPPFCGGRRRRPSRGYSRSRAGVGIRSDLVNQPLKMLCELGGWKTAETVLQCYQRADEGQVRKALKDRRVALS